MITEMIGKLVPGFSPEKACAHMLDVSAKLPEIVEKLESFSQREMMSVAVWMLASVFYANPELIKDFNGVSVLFDGAVKDTVQQLGVDPETIVVPQFVFPESGPVLKVEVAGSKTIQ